MFFNLDHLVDQRLDNPDAHIIIGGLPLMVNRDQVQVDDDKDALDF